MYITLCDSIKILTQIFSLYHEPNYTSLQFAGIDLKNVYIVSTIVLVY